MKLHLNSVHLMIHDAKIKINRSYPKVMDDNGKYP